MLADKFIKWGIMAGHTWNMKSALKHIPLGAPVIIGAIALSCLTSCGSFFAKETKSGSVPAIVSNIAEPEPMAIAPEPMAMAPEQIEPTPMAPAPEKKKGLLGKFFGKRKKSNENTAEATTGTMANMTDTAGGAMQNADDGAGNFATDGVDRSRTLLSSAADSGMGAAGSSMDSASGYTRSAADQAEAAARASREAASNAAIRMKEPVISAVRETEVAPKPIASKPSVPSLDFGDDDTEKLDSVPTKLTVDPTPAPSRPLVDDDGFVPLTPEPKYPSDEGILSPGE
jgi:hypothetical protein